MASVFITEVDDFLGASQACVNPLFKVTPEALASNGDDKLQNEFNVSTATTEAVAKISRRKIHGRRSVSSGRKQIILSSDEVGLNKDERNLAIPSKEEKATVSVADCLACSGCVTSAEAVLVSKHSLPTLRDNCSGQYGTHSLSSFHEAEQRKIAFTISPAVIADLTRLFYFDRDNQENSEPTITCNEEWATKVFLKLATFLNVQLGADCIIDGQFVGDLSLLESAHEFVHRYRATSHTSPSVIPAKSGQENFVPLPIIKQKSLTPLISPSIAISATETKYIATQDGEKTVNHKPGRMESNSVLAENEFDKLPMMSSSCPGFVCFVEKTAPHCIPFLTTAKSAMSIAGFLVKHFFSTESVSSPDVPTAVSSSRSAPCSWYHVAIMPCHDKKLEASRKDLAWEQIMTKSSIPDVDLVITTSELVDLIREVARRTIVQPNGLTEVDALNDEPLFDIASYFVNLPSASIIRRPTFRPTTSLEAYSVCINKMLTILQNNSIVPGYSTFSMLGYTPCSTGLSCNAPTATDSSGSSGSYADFVFRFAAQELFGFFIPAEEILPWRNVKRNNAILPVSQEDSSISHRQVRSRRSASTNAISDFREVVLFKNKDNDTYLLNSTSGGEDVHSHLIPVLKFATAYGFKNIQGVIQKMKEPSATKIRSSSTVSDMSGGYCDYHYMEIMACPSGCLNGGGQVGKLVSSGIVSHANLKKETPAERRNRLWKNHQVLDSRPVKSLLENPLVCSLFPSHFPNRDEASTAVTEERLEEMNDNLPFRPPHPPFLSGPFSLESQRIFHTRFHSVPKLELSVGAVSGVAVSDTKW